MADAHDTPAMTAAEPEPPIEEVDALPVLASHGALTAEARAQSAPARAGVPATQVAAVAAGGFVAGAAVVGLVHRRRRRRAAPARLGARRGSGRSGPVGELVQIVGTRSLLVDVHLLGGRD